MHLYHANCPEWKWKDFTKGRVPRFLLDARNVAISTRTYKCSACGDTIHIDMDWAEGIKVGPDERID